MSDLLTDADYVRTTGQIATQISGIRFDSREVKQGELFVALAGQNFDGHDFLQDVLKQGAAALAVQEDRQAKWERLLSETTVPIVVFPNTRAALSRLAAAFFDYPARQMVVIGVTGTDGKTSLVHLLGHVLRSAGLKAGLISTIQAEVDGEPVSEFSKRHTTPEAPQVQETLARMVAAGCRYAVIESTSHGLVQHRLDDCEYDIAVVTNVGRDHLDFHGSPEEYLAAKGKLFSLLDRSAEKGTEKTAVLNADDASASYLAEQTRARKLTYGIDTEEVEVKADDVVLKGWETNFRLRTRKGKRSVRLRQPGRFNVYNALAAVATGLALGIDLEETVEALASWTGAPGRMELVEEGQPFKVVVDFAHAPDSLERVLNFLRPLCQGKLIALFGCIGERDKQRRYPMGQISGRLADYTIVTDDNPYTEDGAAIIEEIAAGLRSARKQEGKDYELVADRREAIRRALSLARPGDIVLLAGKGHERTVTAGDRVYECDDREVAGGLLRQEYASDQSKAANS
ncbi:MAG TPA: UDP-N-acetylmuramoyl-L-alanyl-D-glutamate--2,6-diaminopimelate ligase [Dehalococcoidia bacterium]|nr:UDP-N-acetylmuramoyl-L-alanyl-D-glutamate--2,6-diaminopimelate ligase [Dehalococcoidia bacterium]